MDVDFNDGAGSSSRPFTSGSNEKRRATEPEFEIFIWYPHYQSCLRYFVDHAQHDQQVQTLASFLNIFLPYQMRPPILSSKTSSQYSPTLPIGVGIPGPMGHGSSAFSSMNMNSVLPSVSLLPYIRRLVATGFDQPKILHGFFGDDWKEGISSLHEVERRNYLFAAKSGSWLEVKREYNLSPSETIPFLKPLGHVTENEISAADREWSNWLAMQDWMVGPRAPDAMDASSRTMSPGIKKEPRD